MLSPEKDNIIEGEGFVFIVPEGSMTQAQTVDEASKKLDYVTDKLGKANDVIVELSQNLWVNVKDATTEEFLVFNYWFGFG